MNHSLEPGLRCRTLGARYIALCSVAAFTTASTSFCIASMRIIGFGVPGSVLLHTSSSTVPTLKLTRQWVTLTAPPAGPGPSG